MESENFPLYLTHGLVNTNYKLVLLTAKRIFEDSCVVLFIITLLDIDSPININYFQGGFSMKKQSNLSRLMGYAGGHKILTYFSWVLSVMSAMLALLPFWYIWRIIHDILEVSPDFSQAQNVTRFGWSAVLFAVLSIVVYIAALMCSHISAFRVAANIRKELMRHITALPLGVMEKYGSGKLRRIVNTSGAATENYLAHRLPDKAGAITRGGVTNANLFALR